MGPPSVNRPMIRIPAVVAWVGLSVACALLAGSPLRAVAAKRVSGNLVFWDQARGFDSIVANADVFSEISPAHRRDTAPEAGTDDDVVVIAVSH